MVLGTFSSILLPEESEVSSSLSLIGSSTDNEFCCLASDPEEHARIFDKAHIVTNAFIAIEAGLRYMGLELISGKWYHA